MNREERISRILELVKCAGGSINSRKKIHKLIYLLQEKNEEFDQNYTFYNYGVFSPTLANDLDYAVRLDYLQENVEKDKEYKSYVYALGRKQMEGIEFDKEIKNEDTFNMLIDKEPRILEVLSTIVYLHRNHYSRNKLKAKLELLKPNLHEHYEKAFELAKLIFEIE